MVTQIAVGAAEAGCAPPQVDDRDAATPAALAASLVAALEQALLAAHRLLGALGTTNGCCAGFDGPALAVPGVRAGELSRREAEVLRLIAAGRSTRQVAQALFLSPRTVQRHVANLYPKIGAHNKAEATAYALRHGLA